MGINGEQWWTMVNNGRIYGLWLMVIIRIGLLIMVINGEQWWTMAEFMAHGLWWL